MTALYELYDSDQPLAIPAGVKAAGYDDGYAANVWATYGWARFPDAVHITVFGSPDSDVFDIETGDGTPAQAGPWAVQRKARRKIAIPYCERVNGHAVEDSLRASGISTAEAMLWIATDDGTEVVTHWLDGSLVTYPVWAVQYLNEAHGSGGHYDRSLVYLAFGGGGSTIGGDAMQYPRDPNTTAIYAVGFNPVTARIEKHALSPEEWAGLQGTGPTFQDQKDANLAALLALPDAAAVPPGGGGGGTEPSEPTKITLTISAIPGTATGTIS